MRSPPQSTPSYVESSLTASATRRWSFMPSELGLEWVSRATRAASARCLGFPHIPWMRTRRWIEAMLENWRGRGIRKWLRVHKPIYTKTVINANDVLQPREQNSWWLGLCLISLMSCLLTNLCEAEDIRLHMEQIMAIGYLHTFDCVQPQATCHWQHPSVSFSAPTSHVLQYRCWFLSMLIPLDACTKIVDLSARVSLPQQDALLYRRLAHCKLRNAEKTAEPGIMLDALMKTLSRSIIFRAEEWGKVFKAGWHWPANRYCDDGYRHAQGMMPHGSYWSQYPRPGLVESRYALPSAMAKAE